MIYKGTISVIGDSDDPLLVSCEVSDSRLMITTRDGAAIGDWGLREIAVQRMGDDFTIRAEGEQLRLHVDRPDALAQELRLGETSNVAERVAAARQSPQHGDRIQWGVVAAIVGALALAGAVLVAVLGVGPFERDNAPEAAPSVTTSVQTTMAPTTSPPPATTRALTVQEQKNVLRDIWLTYMQENPAGVFGYWRRATEADANRDWAAMGAECKLGQTTNQYWRTIIANSPVRPHPAYPLFQAVVDEIDLMFFWCSGGDRYAAEAASTHHDVAVELVERINAEFGIATNE